MKKRFVTIFPKAQNVHLRKGIGQIPFILHRDFLFESTIVCFKNQESYPSLKNIEGVTLSFLKHQHHNQPLIATLRYLWRHAKNIDVLNLYGQSRWTFWVSICYKLLNPNGIVYLKLDMNIAYLQNLKSGKSWKRHLLFWKYYFSRIANIISSEYHEMIEQLIHSYDIPPEKMLYLPNGIDDKVVNTFSFSRKKFEEKENIILCVGRIGAPEKNYELLLKVATKISLENWKIVFVGPCEKAFYDEVQNLFTHQPKLKQNIELIGAIDDFETLCSWYNRSKIFCITSHQEGFPVVLPEAMYWGNCIISTNVSSIHEVLEDNKIGIVVDDEATFAQELERVMKNKDELKLRTQLSAEKAEKSLLWNGLIAALATKLSKHQ